MLAALRGSFTALTLSVLLSGCLSEDQWTFGISRSFYQEGGIDSLAESLDSSGGMAAAGGALMIMAIPAAVDLVLLPVAISVDLWSLVAGRSGADRLKPLEPVDWSEYNQASSVQLSELRLQPRK